MRRQRIDGASCTEPTDSDDLPTTVRIDDAVTIAKTLSSLATHPRYESLLRTMLVNMDTNATLVVVIANADLQKNGYD